MPPRSASRGWFWATVVLTAVKLWLVAGQRIFAIGPAFHDDRLFVELAEHLVNGRWLGPYNQFTLAKGPMLSFFIAAAFKLGVPLLFAQQVLYAAASATLTRSLRPWLRTGAAAFAFYALLLWNPMSYEAENLSRVMRQNVYTPLALFCVAGLVTLFTRRRESARRQAYAGALAGLAFGCFWLTREESVWFMPAVGLLLLAPALALRAEFAARWRALAAGAGGFVVAALLPLLFVSTMNLRNYGWFGTVEFRAPEFNAAYGALMRPITGPELKQVPVTRQMREAAYELSPAFAKLRPYLEGDVAEHWIERTLYPAADKQIRGGWMVWALRDAVREAGLAPDAGAAMRYYQQVADELNAACDSGRVPARPRRSGFVPPLGPELVRPVIDDTITYSAFFFLFRDFSAGSPNSVGDYADLKPFRNMVGTRLSNAPRSPELPTPEQDRRDAWKVDVLQSVGRNLARALGWLGPLLLLIGVVRGIESAGNRRVSFALGLAGALLLSCLAYLAINILVQATSFYNMSPAALAPAYPLYLLALTGIVIDAVQAWRRPTDVVAPALASPASVPRLAWLPAAGVALAVFGARLAEIHFFASAVPYNDQWVIEAQQIIAPWLNGTLGLRDFFIPHFEHLPVWTRLLAWLQVALTGRWDPLVQMTWNAGFYSVFVWLVARWGWSVLRAVPAAALTLLLLLAGALPHAWENIAWGFQSQFPLALIAVFLLVHGSATYPPGSRRWWFAQATGVAGLFTIASFWLAPLALVAGWLWTGPLRRGQLVASGVLAAAGALALVAIHHTVDNSFTQGTRSALQFLHSYLHLLGWPSLLPGSVAVIQLPWVIHALRLRRQADAAPVDRIILALGLFNFLQAAALAFGRLGDTQDFVSRYGDLLFIGTLASAGALARLTVRHAGERTRFLLLTVLWSALVVGGLVRNSTGGHAAYFHEFAGEKAALRLSAVQTFLADGNRTVIESPGARAVLFYDAELVERLLAQPKLAALLPASVNPANPPDAAGHFVRGLQAHWSWFIGLGLLGLLAGTAACGWRRVDADPLAPLPVRVDPWRWRVAAVVGGSALVATLAWSNPFALDASTRWQRWLGGDQALKGLTFSFTTPSPFGPERLQGAAPISPEILRNQFFGTAPEGPGFTGTVVSSPFILTKPWLIVPYAGYPVGNGNGLRVRLVDAQGKQVGDEIGCNGPNLEGVGYWAADVRAHVGQRARLVLYDGRTDTEAWVAASPPIPAESPDLALTLAHGLQAESHSPVRISIALIALVGLVCAFLGWRRQRAV